MEGVSDDANNPFLRKSTNPFDEDVDDEVFLKPSTSRFMVKPHSLNPFSNDIAQGDVDFMDKKTQAQSRTLASTERSLALLMESEIVGEGIGKELTEQKEQLENCHRKVDDINANLRNSQKHLRRIKSFFGGVKDFLMGVKIKPIKPRASMNDSGASSKDTFQTGMVHRSRSTTVKQTASSHPGLLLRASDGDKLRPQDPQTIIDKNLDQMLNHVVCLKDLAVDLGEELDSQNELLDSLNDKSEEAQISMAKQNKDIAKLLK